MNRTFMLTPRIRTRKINLFEFRFTKYLFLRLSLLFFLINIQLFAQSDDKNQTQPPLNQIEALSSKSKAGLPQGTGEIEILFNKILPSGQSEQQCVRLIVKNKSGKFIDGGGRGLYRDGRFFVEGKTRFLAPAGPVTLNLQAGPNFVDATFQLSSTEGSLNRYQITQRPWFRPQDHGWYSGDNHVHAQHDARASIKTNLEYMAIQARAAGLDFVTEAGSNGSYEKLESLNRPDFILTRADEQRLGCFVGHINTPGIREPISQLTIRELERTLLPSQALTDKVHQLGGITIHTHPLTPRHQIHWMGAAELIHNAVFKKGTDLLDIDSRQTELLWYSVLNLGLTIGASSYTDCALGRVRTLSPGDRRVYVHSDEFKFSKLISGMKQAKTFATNGGPLFAFFSVDGKLPGTTIESESGRIHPVKAKIHSWHTLRSIELYYQGKRIDRASPRHGRHSEYEFDFKLPTKIVGTPWLTLRAENEQGDWALTSPIYFDAKQVEPVKNTWGALLQISNATRFIQLRKQFYSHLLVSVRDPEGLESVTLLKDGVKIKEFSSSEKKERTNNSSLPSTTLRGDYQPDWVWGPQANSTRLLQADWPVDQTGWYSLQLKTKMGSTYRTDSIFFDSKHPNSRAISLAQLGSNAHQLRWWGYGEEMPLNKIELPFKGDHWWYPKNTAFYMEGEFQKEKYRYVSNSPFKGFRENHLREAINPQKPIDLLSGKLEDHFYSFLKDKQYEDPEKNFRLENKRLFVTGKTLGYLGTRQNYKNYRLIAEFEWGKKNWGKRVGKARDSGIFLHSQGPDGNSVDAEGAFQTAIECNVMEGAVGDFLLIRGHDVRGKLIPLEVESTVASTFDSENWPRYLPEGKKHVIKTWGRLNHYGKKPNWKDIFNQSSQGLNGNRCRIEIECKDSTIEITVDGKLVNRVTNIKPQSGRILIQSEGSQIQFTRLELHPLDPA